MKITNKELKNEIDSLVFDLKNANSNINVVDDRVTTNKNKIRRVVTKQNKLQSQFNDFVDTYNENLAKQTLKLDNLKRLYKILLAGVTFIGLILIACI